MSISGKPLLPYMQRLNRRFVFFFFILLPSTRKPVQGPLPHVHCNDHLQSILVSPGVLLYALTHHIPLSTRVLVCTPECVVREVLQAGTLPGSLLCYGNEACWTHKSTEGAALCFVSAYTIAKTVTLSTLLPDRELLVDRLLCLVQARQLRRQSLLTLAFHLSEQRDTHLVCLTVCQLTEVTCSFWNDIFFSSWSIQVLQSVQQDVEAEVLCPCSWLACWGHIYTLLLDLGTQGSSVLWTFRPFDLATSWGHSDPSTTGTWLARNFLSVPKGGG